MHCLNVMAYAHRLQDFCRIRRKKKQGLKITAKLTKDLLPTQSAPFNFKKEESILPGISDDEISILREKAAASRIGIADFRVGGGGALHHSHTYSHYHHTTTGPHSYNHHQRRPMPSALSARRGGSLCLNPVDPSALPMGRTSPNVGLGLGMDLGLSHHHQQQQQQQLDGGSDYSSPVSSTTKICRCGGVAASERSVSPQGSFLGLEKEMSL
ncbi:uncharacterized protein E0L32_001661 [Thyridium curvatum]|uniref:Uncharacterized protein n=1 Tax=Thyridium curvatum TaxID=1093900 RepID=A0A507AP18_9PEZI|nr:uncharacterized protein E0L32_001537 [Thyridium curvatum]XP_030990912.1 uncharacterized protein E0L32_001661 [Thyridium curvatum]TPX09077.1 hypothetical protein E0L32_001537 [Thyridium curvatum]TPX09201.1 hypothetical protein E0L32_001661 [Thyridium curvatum]